LVFFQPYRILEDTALKTYKCAHLDNSSLPKLKSFQKYEPNLNIMNT